MVKVHYNQTTKKVEGFYPDYVEYAAIPEPYVEVTDERHAELVEMANSGKELYVKSIKVLVIRVITKYLYGVFEKIMAFVEHLGYIICTLTLNNMDKTL